MRKIKTFLWAICMLFLSTQMFAQQFSKQETQAIPIYKKVELTLNNDHTIQQIAKLGIDVHCGVHISHNHSKNETITLEVSEYEYTQMKEKGLNPTVLIDDLSNFYANRNMKDLQKAKSSLKKKKVSSNAQKRVAQDMGCIEDSYPVPQNFNLGSMGGFTTYQELLDDLDKMANLYPNLITTKASASSSGQTTAQGRPLYYVKVSDNPNADENEPEVLYTGVHHAREPLSMMNLQYYLWYLLENYNTDPTVKNIVDNTELYFIPIVNPDGYVYNQSTNPNGGGMWRKNRRNNGDGTYGVDPNRNYSYNWGYNNTGSSPTSSSDTYRGTAPFSEPETQIMKAFAESHNFINVFNNHSYSNLMLHSWGYTTDANPDEVLLDEISEHMCWHNRYNYGNSFKTINYATNGDANDWFYGEQTTKNKSLAWIPEIGSADEGGFWPTPSFIQDQCERQLRMSLIAAESATNHGVLNDVTPYGLNSTTPTLSFNVQHMSLTSGSFTITVSSSDPNVAAIANPVITTSNLTDTNNETVSTQVTLAAGIAAGTAVSFDVVLNNGTYDLHTTTITKVYNPYQIFYDDCNDLSNWSSNTWGVDGGTGYNANGSITDSPNGNSTNGTQTITSSAPVDLSSAQNPVLEFYTKWDVFRLFSYVQLEISTDGSSWSELCGDYTKPGVGTLDFNTGTPDQPSDEALYDGYQEAFVREQIDLSSYAGVNSVYFRFSFRGDTDISQEEGFWFDDFTVYREPLGHCENAVQDADETGIDCGGVDCLACPTCFDGIQNGNETGTDCGGNCGVCPVCPTSVSTFPYTEGFESGLGQWSQSGGDDLDWTRNSNGTPSSNTGPSSAYEGTWYMYIEASNPNFPTKTSGLISPCFNLSGMATASLNFQYHMYGTSTDMDLDVQISTDGGNSWSSAIWSQTGNQGNQWNTGTVSLDAYANQYVMLRFWGTTGETWSGDISIDDMELNAAPPACTPGTACNDNDACTSGETYDNNCQCNGGTLVDTDNDNVCDTNDQCAGIDDAIIGTTCDDSDPCTSNDVYDGSCACAGTFDDADGDGVCDADDICGAGDDNADADADGTPDACDSCNNNLAGTTCDDGDVCTTGETYDANCNCGGGTFADSDGDTVCDANDQCQGTNDNLIGTTCNDSNPCTTGDVYDSSCNCSGTFADTDGDGVCDDNDICSNGDDNVDNNNNGLPDACEPCPSYDFNTYPVISYDSTQDFGPGIIQDGGATVYMDGNAWKAVEVNYPVTSNTVLSFDFKSTVEGEIHEVGFDNDLTLAPDHRIVVYGNQGYAGTFTNATYNGSGNWQTFTIPVGATFTGTFKYLVLTADDDANSAGNSYYRNVTLFEDSDGDLACDIQCTPGAACNDNDACTTGETYDNGCNCVGGTFVDTDGDNVCDANDQCAGTDDNIIGTSCDDSDPCTTGDVYDNTCTCAGTFADADGDGVCDANDACAAGDDNADADNDGTPDACDNCDNTLNGTACDDGDACTIGDTYDNNCNCISGSFQDSDNDTVCDADDVCASGDDTIDTDNDGTPDACDNCDNTTAGTPCDDNNVCTINDVLDSNCNCAGTVQDTDNDGVCDANDICAAGNDNADGDNDGTPDACDTCDGNLTGTACDDSNVCTTGETYDANCNCGGGTFQDADGDGVCDANDICSSGDDTIDSDGDNTPDACDSCPNDANNACGLPTYCSANATNSNYEFIDNVTFGQINNTSGNNGGYGDFTSISGNAAPGSTVSVSLTAGYPGSSYAENWKIWIDLNRDGDFDDAGEEVFSGSGTGTVTGTASIPANANLGATGMRVAMQWNANSTPCGSFTYGEVEDYTINLTTTPIASKTNTSAIVANRKVSTSINNIISISPNPASTFINLDLDTRLYKENETNTADVNIFTTEGKLVLEQSIAVGKVIQIKIEDLPANQYYLIKMNINNQIQYSNKFLKL